MCSVSHTLLSTQCSGIIPFTLSEITVQFDPVTYTVTEGEGVVAIVKIVSNRAIQGPTVLRVFHNAGSAMGECDPHHVTLNTSHVTCHIWMR